MKVLVACEYSGTVRDALITKLRAQNEKLVRVVKYYNSDFAWVKNISLGMIDYVEVDTSDQFFYKGQILRGGKRARALLKELEIE